MSKSRLSALLRKNLGLESERPLDAANAVETPAAVEETRADAVAPVAEAPVSETPVETPAEVPAETPAAAETPVVAAEKLVVFHTSNESEETAPVAETPAAAVEPAAAEELIVPATTTGEEAAAPTPAEEVPAAAAEVPAAVEETPAAETPVEETPVIATEGEGEEVIEQTPADDTAQGEAEQAAAQAAEQVAEIPATIDVVPAADPAPVAADPAAEVAQPAADVSTEDGAIEEPAAAAGESPAETPVEQAAEQVEQVEQAAAEVVAEDAAPAAAEVPAATTDAPAPVEASTEDGVPAELVSGEEPVVAATEPEAAAQPEDDSAHTFVGVIEADHEIADQAQSLESLVEIADGLNAIAVSLESAIQEGGLQPQAAAMMNLAVQAHTSRLGISQPVTASLENYGGMSARTHATKISLEGVEEVAKQVWETIKQVAATLWKAMVDFAKKLFAASTWVKEKAEKLGEKYKVAKGEAKSKELTLKAGVASRLAVDGKVDGKISKALHDIVTVAFDTVEYDRAGLKAIEHERESVVQALEKGDVEVAAKMFAENDPILPKTFSHANGDTHSTPQVAGGVSFNMRKQVSELGSTPVACYFAGKEKSEHTFAEDVQIRTPDLHEIGQILEVCKMVVSVGEAVEGMGKDLEAEAHKVSLDNLKANSIKEGFKGTVVIAAYRARATQLNRASALVMGHLVTTTRASLQVVEQALNEYEYANAA